MAFGPTPISRIGAFRMRSLLGLRFSLPPRVQRIKPGTKDRDHGEGADQAKVLEQIDGLALNLRRRNSPELMKHQGSRDREGNQDERRPPCPDAENESCCAAQFDDDRSRRHETAKPALAARQT